MSDGSSSFDSKKDYSSNKKDTGLCQSSLEEDVDVTAEMDGRDTTAASSFGIRTDETVKAGDLCMQTVDEKQWNTMFGFPFEKDRNTTNRPLPSTDECLTENVASFKQGTNCLEGDNNAYVETGSIPEAGGKADDGIVDVLVKAIEKLTKFKAVTDEKDINDRDISSSSQSLISTEQNSDCYNRESSSSDYETARSSITEQTKPQGTYESWPPTEEWEIRILQMHGDPEIAKLVIGAERARRKKAEKDGLDTDTEEKRNKYAYVNNTMIKLSDELYFTIKFVQDRQNEVEDRTALKERPEVKYLYDYFTPGPGVELIEADPPTPNGEPSYEALWLPLYADAFSTTSLASTRKRRHSHLVQSFIDFARRCRKVLTCCCKKS